MIWVTRAKYLGEYGLHICFSDGREGCVDLHETIFGDQREIFRQLRDRDLFRRFRVEMDTVVWENGLDLAPEFLHDLLMSADESQQATSSGG